MSEQKKYEFTGKIKTIFGIEFKQIRAIISFGCVVAGEIGGWIECEENLSQYGDAWVSGNARVSGDAEVSGNAWVSGNARVSGDAEVKKDDDYMVIGGAGRYNRFTTFFKCRDKTIKVICGCFFGTIIEFRAKVKETHKGNKHEKVYLAMADMAELQIGNDEVEK
jgi:hypothetical protein